MAIAEIAGDSIIAEVEIAAPPEKVFRALTEPARVMEWWWGQESTYKTVAWEIDLKPGGRWQCLARNKADGSQIEVHGEVLEVDPPNILTYTWNPSWASLPATIVRYTLTPIPSGTKVSLVHSGFGDHKAVQERHRHWAQSLAWLDSYVSAQTA
jgi:uncharacterized protein YndB with AHSA1/START domain